jgi:hypothetical protein
VLAQTERGKSQLRFFTPRHRGMGNPSLSMPFENQCVK